MKKLNLEFLKKTDKQLQDLHLEQTPEGKAARKEIQRRKMVGYWDGTATVYVDPNAKFEDESKVGLITINGVAQ